MSLAGDTVTGPWLSEVEKVAVMVELKLQLSVAVNTTVMGTAQPVGKVGGALFV